MTDEGECLPDIKVVFHGPGQKLNRHLYHEVVCRTLRHIFSQDYSLLFSHSPDLLQWQKDTLRKKLPLITLTHELQVPATLSFYALSCYCPNSFKFFYDMISSWLVPGRKLNVVTIFAADFQIPALGEDTYTLCEVMIHVQQAMDLELILKHWPVIQAEIKLGIESRYFARRIQEMKGLTIDEQTAQILECITWLVERYPRYFDKELITDMQHVLVLCRSDFKQGRSIRHLKRIICYQHLFRKELKKAVQEFPQKRHFRLKILRARIQTTKGKKDVIGLIVGLNFIRDKEIFEKKHLLKAIQNFIPDADAVEASFFANRLGSDHSCLLYLEIEKKDGTGFSHQDVKMLRKALPLELKNRIEKLMHPIFMPRNEEEIMRNILTLSNQISYIRDLPQVCISFDEQSPYSLYFTIVFVRVVLPGQKSIQELFLQADTPLKYIHDRTHISGTLRNRHKKEATVFRLKIAKEQFLRPDHSIDLNTARQVVVSELCRICGNLRDYNGGMISKQNELLQALKARFSEKVKFSFLIIENFFFAIEPVVMRIILDASPLINLFTMVLEAMERNEYFRFHASHDQNYAYVVITTEEPTVKDLLAKVIQRLHLNSSQYAYSSMNIEGVYYLSYLCRTESPARRISFIQVLEKAFFTKKARSRKRLAPV